MNKLIKTTTIDFADACFKSLEMDDKTLTLIVYSWEEKPMRIVFSNTIQFSYTIYCDPEICLKNLAKC